MAAAGSEWERELAERSARIRAKSASLVVRIAAHQSGRAELPQPEAAAAQPEAGPAHRSGGRSAAAAVPERGGAAGVCNPW